jgi:hypothetical protein
MILATVGTEITEKKILHTNADSVIPAKLVLDLIKEQESTPSQPQRPPRVAKGEYQTRIYRINTDSQHVIPAKAGIQVPL